MEVRIGPRLKVKIVEIVLTIQQIFQESTFKCKEVLWFQSMQSRNICNIFSGVDNRMDGTSCGGGPNSKKN
jgi:hypothetical protein